MVSSFRQGTSSRTSWSFSTIRRSLVLRTIDPCSVRYRTAMGNLQVLELQIGGQIERRRKMRGDHLWFAPIEGEVDLALQEDGAQELEAFVERGRAGLLAVQCQMEIRQEVVGQLEGLGGVLGRFAEHQEVVRIAHEGTAEEGEALVELVEEEVGEHGGDHGALGNAAGEGNDPGAVVDLGANPALEEGMDVGIKRQEAEAGEQFVVIDVVKNPFDVRVHHPAEALASELVDTVDGVLDRAALAEGVA